MKKTTFLGGILLLALGPGHADSLAPAATPVSGTQIAPEDRGMRAPVGLREALRQALESADEERKRHRLSDEERQRLREQLRQPSFSGNLGP